jgi:hypothetical protein
VEDDLPALLGLGGRHRLRMALDHVALRIVQHELELLRLDRAAAALVQRLEQRHRARRLQLASLDPELLVAVG